MESELVVDACGLRGFIYRRFRLTPCLVVGTLNHLAFAIGDLLRCAKVVVLVVGDDFACDFVALLVFAVSRSEYFGCAFDDLHQWDEAVGFINIMLGLCCAVHIRLLKRERVAIPAVHCGLLIGGFTDATTEWIISISRARAVGFTGNHAVVAVPLEGGFDTIVQSFGHVAEGVVAVVCTDVLFEQVVEDFVGLNLRVVAGWG